MKDQHSTTNGEVPMIGYDPEYWAHFLDDLGEDDFRGDRPHLITVDELRAAGALEVPAAWRKSLGPEAHDLFNDILDQDGRSQNQRCAEGDAADESPAGGDS